MCAEIGSGSEAVPIVCERQSTILYSHALDLFINNTLTDLPSETSTLVPRPLKAFVCAGAWQTWEANLEGITGRSQPMGFQSVNNSARG